MFINQTDCRGGDLIQTIVRRDMYKGGLEKLNLTRLICLMQPDTIASQKVAERIGTKLEHQIDGIAGDNFP
jgi:hypothetical protein